MQRKWKTAAVTVAVAVLVLYAGAFAVRAQECVNSRCHSGMGDARVVHGPVSVGQCVVCHTSGKPDHPTSSVAEDFKLQSQGKELCYHCHQPKDTMVVVHEPVRTGNCVFCHDPHQSDVEKRLKKSSVSELCFSCHEDSITSKNVVHGPVAAGDCIVCHDPHSTSYSGLVKFGRTELCFHCHPDRRSQFDLKYKHQPAAESCSDCHDPHSADFPYILFSDGETLCLGCHVDMGWHLKASRVKHSAMDQKKCTLCHTAHASDYPAQLKASQQEICYVCHSDLGAQVNRSRYLHGPVSQNDCRACHDSHASDYADILKKQYPAEFYVPYATETYAICFDCHNSGIALQRLTATLTDFRNGEQNLHFLHVNRDKGRSCSACHEMHAGDQARLIRREVPFGRNGWMLPVNFTPSENGGSCIVGCHKPRAYDRIDPVEY